MPTVPSPIAHQIRIAFPMKEGSFCAHFGGASHFRVIDAERATGRILEQTDTQAPKHVPGAFPQWLAQQGVQAVIVGAIGKRAVQLFFASGIAVFVAEPGIALEALVKMQTEGKLVQPNMDDCCSGHGHDHGDQPSDHHCH